MSKPQTRKERMKKDPPNTYVIYPDYWKDRWGDKPILGFVSAYSEFEAKRQAYTRKLLTKNFTIEPEPEQLSKQEVRKLKAKMKGNRKTKRRPS